MQVRSVSYCNDFLLLLPQQEMLWLRFLRSWKLTSPNLFITTALFDHKLELCCTFFDCLLSHSIVISLWFHCIMRSWDLSSLVLHLVVPNITSLQLILQRRHFTFDLFMSQLSTFILCSSFRVVSTCHNFTLPPQRYQLCLFTNRKLTRNLIVGFASNDSIFNFLALS